MLLYTEHVGSQSCCDAVLHIDNIWLVGRTVNGDASIHPFSRRIKINSLTTVGQDPLPGFSGSLVRRKEEGAREERFGTAPCLIKCRVTLWPTNFHMLFL